MMHPFETGGLQNVNNMHIVDIKLDNTLSEKVLNLDMHINESLCMLCISMRCLHLG